MFFINSDPFIPDLVVDGKNFDVYTPKQGTKLNGVLEGMRKKNDQTRGIILDLRFSGWKSSDLGESVEAIIDRIRKKNAGLKPEEAWNIDELIIIE